MTKLHILLMCLPALIFVSCSNVDATHVQSSRSQCDNLRLDSLEKPIAIKRDRIAALIRTHGLTGPIALVRLEYDKSIPISYLTIGWTPSKEATYSCRLVKNAFGSNQVNLCSQNIMGTEIRFSAAFSQEDATSPGKYMDILSRYVTDDVICRLD